MTNTSYPVCRDCGHTHEGPGLAGICVGCHCPTRSIDRGLTLDQVDYLRRALVACGAPAVGPVSPAGEARRGAYRHALTMLDELLAERA